MKKYIKHEKIVLMGNISNINKQKNNDIILRMHINYEHMMNNNENMH